MKVKDKGRKWMWCLLGLLATFQIYFVQELLVQFVLFAIAFAIVAIVFGTVYLLQQGWYTTAARNADRKLEQRLGGGLVDVRTARLAHEFETPNRNSKELVAGMRIS